MTVVCVREYWSSYWGFRNHPSTDWNTGVSEEVSGARSQDLPGACCSVAGRLRNRTGWKIANIFVTNMLLLYL